MKKQPFGNRLSKVPVQVQLMDLYKQKWPISLAWVQRMDPYEHCIRKFGGPEVHMAVHLLNNIRLIICHIEISSSGESDFGAKRPGEFEGRSPSIAPSGAAAEAAGGCTAVAGVFDFCATRKKKSPVVF